MKTKLLFFIFTALLMGMFGCGGTKKVTEEPKMESKQSEVEPPIPFKESYVKNVNYWQDSLLFFNSCKVIISGSIIKKRHFSFFRNGALYEYDDDTLINISKTIEVNKAGHIFEPAKRDKNGIVNIIPVSFSQKDETYQLFFFREDFIKKSEVKNPGSFVMNGKATLVYDEIKYPVVATIDSKEGDNRLLFFYNKNKKTTSINVNESAEGWNSSGSNNNNYQNQEKNKKEENKDSFQEYTPPNK
jgi:hypothetical protein